MSKVTPAQCNQIADALNIRSRKRHDFNTPAQLHQRYLALHLLVEFSPTPTAHLTAAAKTTLAATESMCCVVMYSRFAPYTRSISAGFNCSRVPR